MLYWILGIVSFLILLFFLITYVCYLKAFAVTKRHRIAPEEFPNDNPQYSPYKDKMLSQVRTVVDLPFEGVYITSKDGLKLYGRYYETQKGAPVQILFHGYRSNAFRDFSGGLQLSLASGCNTLLVDQRAHGESEGHTLSFGINERYDCKAWIEYILKRCGKDTQIILTGISMGAATVLMASELCQSTENVVGIIADCGYSSPKAIIRKVVKDMKYPLEITYRILRIAGKIYGGFDIENYNIPDILSKNNIPVLFIHGEDDRFVPCEMSRENYTACNSEKHLCTVAEAGHGISYLVDTEAYCNAVKAFLSGILKSE